MLVIKIQTFRNPESYTLNQLIKEYQGDIDDVWFSKWHLIP